MRLLYLLMIVLVGTSPLLSRSQDPGPVLHGQLNPAAHPVILDIVTAINKDSLTATMVAMVNFGTRFMYSENRKVVAEWIANRFQSYGITDVVLDSFIVAGDTIPEDSVWQYNVIATMHGISAPEEIYLIGAHYDDYSAGDPYQIAPGADDNASGCAVALEIARVIHAKGFQPASTIRFVAFAAEEMIGYLGYSGSMHDASKMLSNQVDLRLVINNDMVANTTGTDFQILGTEMQTGRNKWAGVLTSKSAALYSLLDITPGNYPTSDATEYYSNGFPVAGFQEYGMYWTYHTIHDSVSNCNMELCREATKATCAILLNEQLTPVPQDLAASGRPSSINLHWKETANANVAGFGIYRSIQQDTGYILISQTERMDHQFTDSTVAEGSIYYYQVTSFDQDGYESTPSNITFGAIAPKNRDLLVVKDSKGGFNNPSDSAIVSFYQDIFSEIPFDFSDASEVDSLVLAILGKYKKIIWLSTAYSNQPNSSFIRHRGEITQYVRDGGQLFLSAFQPSFLIANNATTTLSFSQNDDIYRYFKIGQVNRKPPSALNGAYPVKGEYDSLWVDSLKCPTPPIGHLLNVECITPTPDASLIYRFNSAFDTSSAQGMMKGKPVGLEYLGNDFKVIILSVPLYYLDCDDAKTLIELIVKEKFKTPVGIGDQNSGKASACSIQNYPNPCNSETVIKYTLTYPSDVRIELIDMKGSVVLSRNEGVREKGSYRLGIPVNQLTPGIYLIVLKTHHEMISSRMVVF